MSLDLRDHELIQRHVDGETSPEERAGLEERLRAEPELRELREALQGVRRQLDGVGLVDPPPGLRAAIMRAVWGAPSHGRSRPGVLSQLLFHRPALALAATLALGIATGMLLSGLSGGWSPGAVDEAAVSGTIGSRTGLAEVDRARIEGDGLQASAIVRRGARLVVVEIEIAPPRGAEMFVDTAGSGLQPRGFDAQDGLPAAGAILEAAGAYVADAAPGRYRVVLEPFSAGNGEVRIRLQTLDVRVDATLQSGAVTAPPITAVPKS